MDGNPDKAAIRHRYETTRQGHREGDPAKLLAQYGQRWDDLRDGTIVPRKKDEELQRTTDFLAGLRYLAWEDVNPPRIEVSADGTMAWLLGEVRARAMRTQPAGSERELAYRCSWLQVYATRDGRWAAIVNAPSVKQESEPFLTRSPE